MAQQKCNHCRVFKDEEEFSWRWKELGIRNNSCKECMYEFNKNYYTGEAGQKHLQQVKERTQAAREAARDYVYGYLLQHPCQECGESDPRVLEFHHVGAKEMTITRMVSGGWSIARIQAEIEKCSVLCANCHRKITVEEREWYRGRK